METYFSTRPNKNPMSRHIDKKDEYISEDIRKYYALDMKKLKFIGNGAFGKVYLAYSERLGFLAIKEICLQKPEDLHVVLYEHKILKIINEERNPNFLKYYGIFRKTEMDFVIEMACGEIDLKTMIELRQKAFKPYSLEEIAYILQFLSNQYAFLETKRIAHSDVKPNNVIIALNENSQDYLYCIADFGISLLLEEKENITSINNLSGFTPSFASPEIKLIEKGENTFENYDPFLSDVYSLGILSLKIMDVKKKGFLKNSFESKFVVFFIFSNIDY